MPETLYNFVMEILMLYERPRVRRCTGRQIRPLVSILVFIPREKYEHRCPHARRSVPGAGL